MPVKKTRSSTPNNKEKKRPVSKKTEEKVEEAVVIEEKKTKAKKVAEPTTTLPQVKETTEKKNTKQQQQQQQQKKTKQQIKKKPVITTEEDDDSDDERIDEAELQSVLNAFDKKSGENRDEADESSDIKLTTETVPESDSDLIIKDEKSKLHKSPPIHYFVHLRRKFLKIVITLHKIPEKFMSVDIEDDHFTVDTTAYSKKWYLKRKYPGLIKVDKSNIKAELASGDILTVWVPIVSMPQETFDKELAIIQGRIKEKSIKFKPEQKKIIAERAKRAEKKAAQKKRQREKERFAENNLDIKQKKKKQKLN